MLFELGGKMKPKKKRREITEENDLYSLTYWPSRVFFSIFTNSFVKNSKRNYIGF